LSLLGKIEAGREEDLVDHVVALVVGALLEVLDEVGGIVGTDDCPGV
jgi:hypothetical protein